MSFEESFTNVSESMKESYLVVNESHEESFTQVCVCLTVGGSSCAAGWLNTLKQAHTETHT